jgi:hypothetical protein
VPLLFVRAGEFAAANVAAEGFFTRVSAYVGGEVVGAREGSHADAARERFLTCVDANVPCQLVRATKPSVAVLHRTGVGPLVDRGLARSVGVLARFHGHKLQGDGTLLVDLRQNLVTLARGGVVLG